MMLKGLSAQQRRLGGGERSGSVRCGAASRQRGAHEREERRKGRLRNQREVRSEKSQGRLMAEGPRLPLYGDSDRHPPLPCRRGLDALFSEARGRSRIGIGARLRIWWAHTP